VVTLKVIAPNKLADVENINVRNAKIAWLKIWDKNSTVTRIIYFG